jgi:hypothetical protein
VGAGVALVSCGVDMHQRNQILGHTSWSGVGRLGFPVVATFWPCRVWLCRVVESSRLRFFAYSL